MSCQKINYMPFKHFWKILLMLLTQKIESSVGNTSFRKVIPFQNGGRGMELGCVNKRDLIWIHFFKDLKEILAFVNSAWWVTRVCYYGFHEILQTSRNKQINVPLLANRKYTCMKREIKGWKHFITGTFYKHIVAEAIVFLNIHSPLLQILIF